ncbi:MAG: cobyrinate a,c-diamide synthase [Ktedonobacteraceae bacterium]
MSTSAENARIIVAGVASGVGKTTICTGLMAALVARGLRVQGYKVGPDYIDPTYHRAATGRPSYNLDTWLSSQAMVQQRFDAGMHDADIALIEGVMGLFDGRKQTRDTASTAEIARLLNAPVVLVIDVSHMGQSVAAIVNGFQHLDPRVHLVGVILNKVASADHEATLRYAIEEWTKVPVLGSIRRNTLLMLPARHLGLIPIPEQSLETQVLADAIEHTVNVTEILRLAQQERPGHPQGECPSPSHTDEPTRARLWEGHSPCGCPGSCKNMTGTPLEPTMTIRIGLALDDAFSFYYPETLEAFARSGADVVPFSPLQDTKPPDDIDLFYFGGGFPEVFAEQLANNRAMLSQIHSRIQQGTPVYAECGGYMYLGTCCIDTTQKHHQLVGAIPYTFRMGTERAQIGYREITTTRNTILGPVGMHLRGHEFHWSHIIETLSEAHAPYQLAGREPTAEGYANENILASYVHVPLAAHPQVLTRLVQTGRMYRQARMGWEK